MKRYKQLFKKTRQVRQVVLRRPYLVWRWWLQQDRRLGLKWRIGSGVVAVMVLVSIVIPIAQQLYQADRYKLSAQAMSLVGTTNGSLLKQLTYDANSRQYQFNKDAISNSALPPQLQKASVGNPGSKSSSTYALDIPEDFSRGATYHDVNSNLSFTMTPQFSASQGKQVDGHIVFPLADNNQAIYTLKGNGLKEDIVVPAATTDTMSFSYTLKLPKSLEAKVIPDSNGAIGIYSGDPSLFGNISYGSNKDQALVEKARDAADKNYLVFGLPAPVIKTADGKSPAGAMARFDLAGNQLSVIGSGLTSIQGAFTIDPSVVVTSTSDFQTNGNNESNIDFSTSGQINRAGLNGASVFASGWSSGTTIVTAVYRHSVLAYNGYMYSLGGEDVGGVARTYVQYAPINTNGTLGTWHYTHNSTDDGTTFVAGFTTGRYGLAATVYNGYVYIFGGTTNGTTPLGDVQYAPINSNGTVGTWVTLPSSYGTAVASLGAAAYNGYMYVYGGTTNSTAASAVVQYAPINADGTLGTWTSTTSLSGTGRYSFASAVYNGYLYIMGGRDASTLYNDVQYAPINANGTLGSFVTTTSFTTSRYYLGGFANNGYLYIMGGSSFPTDIQYAPINANGSVGAWANSTTLTGRSSLGAVAYNGYIYAVGGSISSGATNTTQYAKIDPAGEVQSWRTDSSHTISAARALVCTVAYNGYLYAIGGSTSDSSNGNVATVQYTAISSNGALSTWNPVTSLPGLRGSAGCTASNGFIYVVGGYVASSNVADGAVLYSPVAANGTLGSWTTSTHALNQDIGANATPTNPGVFVYGGYIYSVGGDNSNAGRTGVYYAPLNADGSIGTWVTTNSLLNNYTGQAFAQTGKYIYAFGGNGGGTVSAAVEYAPINSDGTVGTWTATTSMPGATSYSHGTAINGCIYSVGGENSSGTSLNKVYFACPNSDGSITSWNTAPNLVTATTDMGITSTNGIIFGVGGYTTAVTGNIAYAFVNNGGTGNLMAWNTSTSFTTGRDSFGAVAYNGSMYILGGQNSSATALSDVQRTSISSTGVLGSWSTTGVAALPSALYGASTVTYNGYIYVIGGTSTPANGNTSLATYYAKINTDGTLGDGATTAGTWFTGSSINGAADGYSHAIDLMGAVAYNGYVYVLGGNWCSSNCATAQTQYAAINSDGSLGAWTISTVLPSGRIMPSSFAANGYIYVIGGLNSNEVTTVYYAPLNSSTGAIGAWQTTTPIPIARQGMAISYLNGFVYVSGGYTGVYSANTTTSFYAPVNASGAIGQWQSGSAAFSNARSGAASVTYNGYLYVLGGSGASEYADTQYASVQSISRTGRYSKLIDLGSPTNVTGITYNGTIPGGMSAISYRAAGGNGTFFNQSNSSSAGIALVNQCTSNVANTRYLLVSVVLDDSAGGVFADATGPVANLADLTVNYTLGHPAPSIRLRAGQVLQAGSLSPLDTCQEVPSAPTVTAAPTIVGGSSIPSSSTTSNTITLNSGTQTGDLVIISAYVEPANEASSGATYGTITAPSGVTLLSGFPINTDDSTMTSSDTHRLYVWYYYATSSGATSLTFSTTQNDWWSLVSVTIRGGPTSGNPLADTASTGTTSTSASGITATPSVSLNLAAANSLVLWVYGDWSGNNPGYPTGFSDAAHGGNYSGQSAIGYKTYTTTGSTGSVTASRSGNEQGMTAALLSFRGH